MPTVTTRSILLCALVVAVAMVMLPALARADIIEPLYAVVANEAGDLFPDSYDMDLNGTTVLIGLACGGYIPYQYSWRVDSVQAGQSYDFTYTATSAGEHGTALKVIDSIGQVATDSVTIRVHAIVPTRPTTWGRLKALCRNERRP